MFYFVVLKCFFCLYIFFFSYKFLFYFLWSYVSLVFVIYRLKKLFRSEKKKMLILRRSVWFLVLWLKEMKMKMIKKIWWDVVRWYEVGWKKSLLCLVKRKKILDIVEEEILCYGGEIREIFYLFSIGLVKY